MSEVQYKEISGFPGYRVGSDGSVWSKWRRFGLGPGKGSTFILGEQWKKLKPHVDRDGYHDIKTFRNGKRYRRRVHHLVLEAFVGLRPKGMQTRHKNGRSDDNRLDNLLWGTSKDNQEDRRQHGTLPMGEQNAWSKLDTAKVKYILQQHGLGASNAELGRELQVTGQCIAAVLKGKTWRHVTGLGGTR